MISEKDKRVYRERLRELCNEAADGLFEESLSLLECGKVDFARWEDSTYTLPKIILSAAMHRKKDAYAPAKWQKDELRQLRTLRNA